MTSHSDPRVDDLIAGALAWWKEAGVDLAYSEEPRKWWQDPEPAAANAIEDGQPHTQRPRIGGAAPMASPQAGFDAAALPGDLETFTSWWLAEPALCEGGTGSRVPPRGATGARVMIVVPEPEREDRDTLLAGPQGRLVDAMLAAMDIEPAAAYRASVLPRHMPGTDWDAMARRGLGRVLAHHVSLVAPKRLIVFGTNILPLAGNDPPQGPADLRVFNHGGTSIPLLACRSLAALLERPRWKAGVWQAWLDWTG